MGVEVVIPIAFFLTVVFIIKIVADNRIRTRLIEKGQVDESVKQMFSLRGGSDSLKWGMVLLAIGAAVVIGQIVPRYMRDEITVAGIFLGSGLALIVYYFIAPRQNGRDRSGNGSR